MISALMILASLSAAPAAPPPPVTLTYAIDAELHPSDYRLSGRTEIIWSHRHRSVRELRLQLFLNAWRNAQSTWMRRSARGVPAGVRWGGIDITAIIVEAPTWSRDLTASARFIAPDDGNADDRTVMQVDLPEAIGASDAVSIRIQWTAVVPSFIGDTGARRRHFFLAHSSPQLCDVESDGWQCPQADPSDRTPATVADYTVHLTAPSEWIVGATGTRNARTVDGGRVAHGFHQRGIRGFAWTASPDFVDVPLLMPTSPVAVRLLLQPEHRGRTDRFVRAVEQSLLAYRKFAPFPFDHLTIVDVPWHTHTAAGYPGLVTTAVPWLTLALDATIERDVARGVAQQWWGNLVAVDPLHDTVTAPALAEYSQARVVTTLLNRRRQTEAFGFYSRRLFGGLIPWVVATVSVSEPIDGNAPVLALTTIERYAGWAAMQHALAAVAQQYAYQNVDREQVMGAMGAAIGQDLSWFTRQVFGRSTTFDYAVSRLTTAPRPADECRAAPCFRTEVVVNRLGDGQFTGTSEAPVGPYQAGRALAVLVRFADGSTAVDRWDGRAPARTFEFESRGAAVSAQVDPDRVLLLDRHPVNNSITRAPAGPRVASAWSARWAIWLQDLMLSWASLV